MKKLLLLLILQSYLYCSTLEQVEEYISVSHVEENILLLEERYSEIQNGFTNTENAYDMQLLMFRFKEFLETHLSEDEMNEILANYKNLTYLQFTSNQMTKDDYDKTQADVQNLKEDPDYQERLHISEQINKILNKKEIIGIMYDDLMTPFMKNSIGGGNISKKMIKNQKNAYVKSILDHSIIDILYYTKEFNIDELEELLNIIKSSSIEHERKTIYKATAYTFKEFFISIANRYDLTQHQIKSK